MTNKIGYSIFYVSSTIIKFANIAIYSTQNSTFAIYLNANRCEFLKLRLQGKCFLLHVHFYSHVCFKVRLSLMLTKRNY